MAERGNGDTVNETLVQSDQAIEYLMMSLRLSEGTDLARLARLGLKPDPEKITHLSSLDLLEPDVSRLKVTQAGRRVLNGVLRELLVM
jgi:oxygen-independent coproporphyrinogen-3 oxidase